MKDFLIGLRMTLRPPHPEDPERPYWLLKLPYYVASYVWFRGPYGFARERYWRLQWWLHRGDVDSPDWMPVRNEVVTTCDNRRGVVVGRPEYADRMVAVAVDDERGSGVITCSWTCCLEPGWPRR